ncbi:MAG: hypothetical protein LBT68_00870 [Spirochaetales bacterium]|jgi:hypothetical protein|nr:hypothetical protein [Spirochaetales bacterium]
MAWMECPKCKHQFDSGFFYNRWCPKCRGAWGWIKWIIGKCFKIGIPLGIAGVIMVFAAPELLGKGIVSAAAALDSRVLYTYGKEAYLNGVTGGAVLLPYSLTAKCSYYKIIVSGDDLKEKALGTLEKGQVVQLGAAIRRNENVFIPAQFYLEDKAQQVFLLFPRHWEDGVKSFDWDAAVKKIQDAYIKAVKSGFKLMEVKTGDKKFKEEEYPDYYEINEFATEKSRFYAKKNDKPDIEKIYAYYLGGSNPGMVITQAAKDWKRPALELGEKEKEKK